MSTELDRILESKRALRHDLAGRPVAEKLRILEELTERTLATRKEKPVSLPSEPWTIPRHWRWSRMGDVATVVGGGTPPTDREDYFGGDVPWITPADLSRYHEKTISRGSRNITQSGLANSGARLLPSGTVLFSSRAPIGYVAIAANPVATNQGFKSFVLGDDVDPSFTYHYLRYAKFLAVALAGGTTFLEISGKNAAQIPIPVPPLPDQLRIVAEIEKHLTRLDAGVASIVRAKANLKRYRAAILAASFPATRLPAGWRWSAPAELARAKTNAICAGPFGTIFKAKDFRDTGVPIIFLRHVAPGKYLTGKPGFMDDAKWNELFKPYSVFGGELLITKLGEPPGACAIYPEGIGPAMVTPDVIKMSVNSEIALPKFLMYYFNSEGGRRFGSTSAFGTTRLRLTISMFREMPVPLPPLAEQHRIVAEVERRLTVVDELEQLVNATLQRAKSLRHAILHRAFSGEL